MRSPSFSATALAWREAVARLSRDRLLAAGLAAYALAIFTPAIPAIAQSPVGEVLQLIDPFLLGLAIVAFLWNRQAATGRERWFWSTLAVAWSCWLAVELIYFLQLTLPVISAAFATDGLYIGYYLLFALAVDLRPHVGRGLSLSSARRRIESIAGVTAFFGVVIYFAIVVAPEPLGISLNFVPRSQGLTSVLLVHLSLDLLLLGRLVFAALNSRGLWSRLYFVLAGGMFFLLVKHALALVLYLDVLPTSALRFPQALFPYLPGVVFLVAARYRRLAIEDASDANEIEEEKDLQIRQAPIALYALLVPAIHFAFFPLGLLDPESHTARELFSLVYIVVLGGLAWYHERVVASEARENRRALREAEDRLFRSQRLEAVGRLAGGIAHDFNNYLTVISGYGEMVLRGAKDEQARSDVRQIQEAASKATHLTRQLLAFGRRQMLRPETLDLNQVVNESVKLLRTLLEENIDLELDLDETIGRAQADLAQTEQVLMNLAINARDAMPGGGTLLIRTRPVHLSDAEAAALDLESRPYIGLFVCDDGTGMSPEVLARIFEPFFTTKELGKGTGLGMSTVYGIVSQSGGAVTIDSKPGRGTTVRVLLPTAGDVVAAEIAEESGRLATVGEGKVLLVEDQAAVRRLAARTLRDGGYEVFEANSGDEAVQRIQDYDEGIDLLITDVMMPGMNGMRLAAFLLERWPGLRVLFVSGYPVHTLRERQAVLPASIRFLQKPFRPKDLLRAVQDVFDEPPPEGAEGFESLLAAEASIKH